MTLSLVVVPFYVNSDVTFACPICCDLVMLFENLFEMVGVFFANIFDSEIVYYECELDRAGVVFPEAGDEFALVVAVFVESFLEELVCK